MNAKSTVLSGAPKEIEAREENQERLIYWQRVRRRLLGAGAMVLLLVFLWRLGVPHPPAIQPSSPPDDVPSVDSTFGLVDVRQKLQDMTSFSFFGDDETAETDSIVAADSAIDSESDFTGSENNYAIDSEADSTNSENNYTIDSEANSTSSENNSTIDSEADSTNSENNYTIDSESDSTGSENNYAIDSEADSTNSANNSITDSIISDGGEDKTLIVDEVGENSENGLKNNLDDTANQAADEKEETAAVESEIKTKYTPDIVQALKKPFIVFVGSFSMRKNALNAEKILRENKFKVYIEKANVNGVLFYRVRVAGYASRAEAKAALDEISKLVKLVDSKPEVRDTR